MVYDLTGKIPTILNDIRVLEMTMRTDGLTPLLVRAEQLVLNLDRQPNKTPASLPSMPTTVFYVIVEYYTIYYLHDGVNAYIVQIDIKSTSYNLRPSQPISTSVDYAGLVPDYAIYRTTNCNYAPYVFVKRKGKGGKFNLMKIDDKGCKVIMFDIDFDEIIPFGQYEDGFYGKGYLYGDKGWYKLFTNHEYEYRNDKENNEAFQRRLSLIITEALNSFKRKQKYRL